MPFIVQIWVSKVELSGEGKSGITISAHAWVNALNSPRTFFEGSGYLPLQTPAGLCELRSRELIIIKARACPSGTANAAFEVQSE